MAIKALEKAGMVNYMATGDFHGIINALNVIKALPAAEPKKRTEKRTETHARDCISRQLALDVMNGRFETLKQAWGDEIRKDGVAVYLDMRGIIEALPSAQPETHEERMKTHARDCISRRAAIDALIRKIRPHNNGDGTITMCVMSEELVRETLDDLPSAQPEIVRCKECKYWKDSDGVYRRGFDAESKCPLNLKKVYEGTFYCGMAERRTDENNNE